MHNDCIPEPLKRLDQWIVWQKKSAPTSAINGKRAGWNENLAPFETAATYCQSHPAYKLGFAFADDGLFGIDLDSCRDPDTGAIEAWATEIINQFGTYAEVSQSGTGIKLVGIGTTTHQVHSLPAEKKFGEHEPHFEVFTGSKYFALTGDVVDGKDGVVECQSALDWLDEWYTKNETVAPALSNGSTTFTVPTNSRDGVTDFNRRHSVLDILGQYGYQQDLAGNIVRPGKDPTNGHSATFETDAGGTERVAFWSSNCQPFEQSSAGGKASTYDAWACNVLLNYGGDFKTAAKVSFGGSDPKPTLVFSVPEVVTSKIDPDDLIAYQPFPVQSLPGLARDFVQSVSEVIDCDPAAVALPLLPAMAVSIGRTIHLHLNHTYEVYAILWTCLVASSGQAKTPPWVAVRKLLSPTDELWDIQRREAEEQFELEQEAFKKQKSKWKKGDPLIAKPDKPPKKRILADDVTIEGLADLHQHNPRGLLIAIDELAGLLTGFNRYSGGSGEVNRWLSLYGGGALQQDRKTVGSSIYVPRTAVSICGGIQPDRFDAAMGSDGFAAGLAARFAIAAPPARNRKWSRDPGVIKDDIKTVVESLIRADIPLNELGSVESLQVTLSSDAGDLYEGYFNVSQEQIMYYRERTASHLEAALSKLTDTALRLALVFHVFKGKTLKPEISFKTMQEGIEVADYFVNEAKRLYLNHRSALGSLRQDIIELLEVEKGIQYSPRDMQNKRNCLKKYEADIVRQACAELVSLGLVKREDIGTTKPKRVYFVEPDEEDEMRF